MIDTMKKEIIRSGNRNKPWPRAVKAGDFVYTASAAMGDDGKCVSPDFEVQLEYVLNDMKEALESAGSSMDNLVQATIFLVHLERDEPKIAPIWTKYIKSAAMVASIGTNQLLPLDPPLLVEITATAIVSD